MAQSVNLSEREQRAYMRYHQDGLADLLIGLGILLAGLNMLLDWDVSLGALWVVLWLPIWLSAKKSITARRIPDVQVSREQYAGMLKAGVFVSGMLVLLVAAVLLVLWGQTTGNIPAWFLAVVREYFMVFLGLFGALVLAVAAWLSGLNRLYAYALLTAVAFVGGYLLNAPIALAVAVVGGIIMLWGLGMLVSFVRKYPLQQQGWAVRGEE
jgi:hypothetical protein